MYVYFIQEDCKNGHVKIGKSSDVAERYRTLQTANPRKLVIIGIIKAKSEANALSIEKDLHNKLIRYMI